MKRLNRLLLVLLMTLVFLAAAALPLYAGQGTYTEGTPDEIVLHVVFRYDEPCFGSSPTSCPVWENLFEEGSKLLYDATERQVRISKVVFYNNCKARADVHIHDDEQGAWATVGGLGREGAIIRMSKVHTTTTTGGGAGNRGQFGLVHEMGHYVFGLLDEYLDKNGNSVADAYCIDQNGTTASIMDGGTTVNPTNRRTEFCWSGNHRSGHTEQDRKRTVGGVDYENTDCWTFMRAYVQNRWGATLTLPTANPTSNTAGNVDPTFEYRDCGVRVVTCIDRSGSMDGAPMTLAKSGAKTFINLTGVFTDTTVITAEVGVSSYSDSGAANYAINPMIPANKTAAKAAIDAISAGGNTNIGGGLQTSLSMITGEGTPVSNEVIVLLSDGQHNTGTHPDSVIPGLIARGVAVYTIGLGDVDASLMRRIATQTGGNYIYANSNAEMKGHFQQILAALLNYGMLKRRDGRMGGSAGASASYTVTVGSFTISSGRVTFLLTWDDPSEEMNLTVKRPNGTTVSDGDAGVEYMYDAANGDKYYRLTSPPQGTYTVTVGYAGATELNYSMQVQGGPSELTVGASASEDTYTYPDPILVQARVVAVDQVAGAEVTAEVVRPNWGPAQITLYDDGLETHGDLLAEDGVYSNYFSGFSGDGSYTFNITVNNESGYTSVREEDGGSFTSQPVDPFVRETQVTVVVSGAPPPGIYLPVILKEVASGFNSQFNGSATGWESHSGTWTVDSDYYSTTGLAGTSASASYGVDFTNFDYQVRLWRSGCDTCTNRILIRGTPAPLGSGNRWYGYYAFQYTRNGSYSIWKRVAGGDVTALQDWTASSAINRGDAWNTLRVVADGADLYFYVNGTLVWWGSDYSLTSGRVGIGMYRTSDSSGDQLFADWATLSGLGTTGLEVLTGTGAISAEQRALNAAARGRGGGSEDVERLVGRHPPRWLYRMP